MVIIDKYLKSIDAGFRYYTMLAMIIHLWREMPKAVFVAWRRRYGAASALKHARRKPPKCIAGRWSSVSATEQRLDDAGSDLAAVLRDVLEGFQPLRPGDENAALPIQDDDGLLS